MEQLIFIGLILFLSILDGLARKKRAGGGAEEADEGSRAGGGAGVERPHRDTGPGRWGGARRPAPASPRAEVPSRTADRGAGPPTSEGMIPSDVWEEIEALARGTRVEPKPREERVEPRPWDEAEPEPASVRPPPEHRVHLAHAGYGTDPSLRAPAPPVRGLDRRATDARADVRAVRKALAAGPAALRRAVIVSEVLGPPVSYREPAATSRLWPSS